MKSNGNNSANANVSKNNPDKLNEENGIKKKIVNEQEQSTIVNPQEKQSDQEQLHKQGELSNTKSDEKELPGEYDDSEKTIRETPKMKN